MTHAVLIQNKVAAQDVGSYNRSVYSGSNVDNGNVFTLVSQSTTTGQSELWVADTSGSWTSGLWMAAAPEIVTVSSGGKFYRGIDPDPTDFFSGSGLAFDAFLPRVGDVITITADGMTGTAASAFVNSGSALKMNWSAAPLYSAGTTVTGLNWRYLATTYISKPSGVLGEDQRVTAYKLECISN